MIRHFVAMRFKPGTSETTKGALMADLGALDGHLGGISDFQVRANISPEAPLVRGFRDVFWFDFMDATARDAYLDDAEHKAIGARIVAELDGGADGIAVFDFEV